jgi:peptidoglycan/LPS O-acetylase OafA/YrhL
MTRLAEAKTSDEFRRPENQPSYEPRHLPALDGIRGIAILMVLLTHLGAILRDVRIIRYFEFGWIGVDLFFVLSGFLITRILLETRTDPQYYRRFYIRRGLRIWPLYYAYLLVMVVLVHALRRMYAHSPGNFGSGGPPVITGPLWMYLFFLQNLRPASLLSSKLSMSITWSLCIEEHFYLVWPVFVRNFAIRTLKYGLLAVLVLSPLMRLGAIFLLRDDGYSVWLRTVGVLTPFHLDAALYRLLSLGSNSDHLLPCATAARGHFFVLLFSVGTYVCRIGRHGAEGVDARILHVSLFAVCWQNQLRLISDPSNHLSFPSKPSCVSHTWRGEPHQDRRQFRCPACNVTQPVARLSLMAFL